FAALLFAGADRPARGGLRPLRERPLERHRARRAGPALRRLGYGTAGTGPARAGRTGHSVEKSYRTFRRIGDRWRVAWSPVPAPVRGRAGRGFRSVKDFQRSPTCCGLGAALARRDTRSMPDLLARHRAVMPKWMALYYDEPIEIVSGKGCRVVDSTGKSYLDFFAGILTNMIGYDVPEVKEAVERQLATGVVHTSTLYLIRGQVELAEKIARLSGIPNAKVFFTNSGTEANETALLLATYARGTDQVLAMRQSYHGRSFGAISVTSNRPW